MAFRPPWLLLVVVLAAVGACATPDGVGGGGSDTTGSVEADVAGDDAVVPEAAGGDEPPAGADVQGPEGVDEAVGFSTCAFRGRVLADDDSPVEKAMIVVCGEDASLCWKATSKADGTFSVAGAARSRLGVKVLGAKTGHTSVTLPQAPCAQPETDLGDIVLFTPASGQVVTAATGGRVQAHPDLWLDLPAELSFPNYEEATSVQAALVDLGKMHPTLTAQLQDPIAAFAIVPYDTEVAEPVSFDARLPSVASSTVGVAVLDYLTGHFVELADAPVDASGLVHVAAEHGLPQLTWVAFVAR